MASQFLFRPTLMRNIFTQVLPSSPVAQKHMHLYLRHTTASRSHAWDWVHETLIPAWTDGVPVFPHGKTAYDDMYGFSAYFPDCTKPREASQTTCPSKRVGSTNASFINSFYHSYHVVALLGIQLLETFIVRVVFVALFVKLHGTFFFWKAKVTFLSGFTVYGQVYGICAAPIKECENEQLVTKDAFAEDMVKLTRLKSLPKRSRFWLRSCHQ